MFFPIHGRLLNVRAFHNVYIIAYIMRLASTYFYVFDISRIFAMIGAMDVKPQKLICPTSRKKQYQDYLHSTTWQRSKNRFLKVLKYRRKTPKCKICSSTKNLNLHHKSYKRIGKERKGDLCFLCGSCHLLVHEVVKNTPLNTYNAPGQLRKVFKKFNNKISFRKYVDFCLKTKKTPERRDALEYLRLSSDCCAENNCSFRSKTEGTHGREKVGCNLSAPTLKHC